MSVMISGNTYYRTLEVCRQVGISRNTLYRWLREGAFDDVENIDRRGWRLFTQDDVDRLRAEANKIYRNKTGGNGEKLF
jgi:excisionase family DNA binding protein